MGKTNVLDAIYYLSFCKSSVSSQDPLNVHHEEDFFMLEGRYVQESSQVEEHVVCSLRRGQRKRVRRNNKEYKRLVDHVGVIPLVMICPNDLQIVCGGSEERRKFMDMVISQYDTTYLSHIMRYQQTLQQRNVLLKAEDDFDTQYMSLLEEMLSESAAYIYAARALFVEEFTPVFQELYQRISGSNYEKPTINYDSHGNRGDLLPWLQNWREKERIVGYTLHGPHKDNLQLMLNGFELKHEGSQGQTKTYFISMKLAQYIFLKNKREINLGSPILLLDDIFDKLDARRVENIVNYVSGDDFGQIFITDTNREHLDNILSTTARDFCLFSVAEGSVEQILE